MRPVLVTTLVMSAAMIAPISAIAELDVSALAEAYREHDMSLNEGRGYSEATSAATLAWGQGPIINSYLHMWEATEDPYWLGKISEHFHRMMDTASDPEGDGYLSWYTDRYSAAVAWTDRLHNVSDARIDPDFQRIRGVDEAPKATGHTYMIDFIESAERFRIIDWTTHEIIADGLEHDGTETEIDIIEPFTLTVSGETHQGDRFLMRSEAQHQARYIVGQGIVTYPVARFIEVVRSRPDLQERFGDDADEFLHFINHNIFEKNERDWLDMGELGGAYRSEPRITNRFPNRIIPHNQYAEIARVWLVLKDVDGAHPLMAERAEQMVRYFHNHLELDEEDDSYVWRYWNWMEHGEAGSMFIETTNYANIDITLAVEATHRGVIFTDEDMQRFVNTWLRVMWNQDEEDPMMARNVQGEEPYRFTPLMAGFVQLAEWEPRVHELALTHFLGMDEERQARQAPIILLSAARAGVLDER